MVTMNSKMAAIQSAQVIMRRNTNPLEYSNLIAPSVEGCKLNQQFTY